MSLLRVLFVSHQMGSIMHLCSKAILLNKGQVVIYDKTSTVVETYLSLGKGISNKYKSATSKQLQEYYFDEIYTVNQKEEETDQFGFSEPVTVIIKLVAKKRYSNVLVGFNLINNYGNYVSSSLHELIYDEYKKNINYEFRITVPHSIIAPNMYSFRFAIFGGNGKLYDVLESECQFKINDTGSPLASFEGVDYGNVILDFNWKKSNSKILQ